MKRDLSPESVAARLEVLRAISRPMTEAEARAALTHRRDESFEVGVARRLAELRALLELTSYLQRRAAARPPR